MSLSFAETGVPVVMVSGDDKLCLEAKNWLGSVETAMTNRETLQLNAAANARMIPITVEEDAGGGAGTGEAHLAGGGFGLMPV